MHLCLCLRNMGIKVNVTLKIFAWEYLEYAAITRTYNNKDENGDNDKNYYNYDLLPSYIRFNANDESATNGDIIELESHHSAVARSCVLLVQDYGFYRINIYVRPTLPSTSIVVIVIIIIHHH